MRERWRSRRARAFSEPRSRPRAGRAITVVAGRRITYIATASFNRSVGNANEPVLSDGNATVHSWPGYRDLAAGKPAPVRDAMVDAADAFGGIAGELIVAMVIALVGILLLCCGMDSVPGYPKSAAEAAPGRRGCPFRCAVFCAVASPCWAVVAIISALGSVGSGVEALDRALDEDVRIRRDAGEDWESYTGEEHDGSRLLFGSLVAGLLALGLSLLAVKRAYDLVRAFNSPVQGQAQVQMQERQVAAIPGAAATQHGGAYVVAGIPVQQQPQQPGMQYPGAGPASAGQGAPAAAWSPPGGFYPSAAPAGLPYSGAGPAGGAYPTAAYPMYPATSAGGPATSSPPHYQPSTSPAVPLAHNPYGGANPGAAPAAYDPYGGAAYPAPGKGAYGQ